MISSSGVITFDYELYLFTFYELQFLTVYSAVVTSVTTIVKNCIMTAHASVAQLMSVTELCRFIVKCQSTLSGCRAVIG